MSNCVRSHARAAQSRRDGEGRHEFSPNYATWATDTFAGVRIRGA